MFRHFFLITLVVFAPLYTLNAVILHVPAQYPTIQQAVNAAQPGDEIVVASGIYYPATANSKSGIVIRGNGFLGANRTIIAFGGSSVSGITFNNCYDCGVSDFEIAGVFQGVRVWYSNKIRISNIYAHDNYQDYSVAVSMQGSEDILIHHCVAERNGYTNLWALNSNFIRIINNTIVYSNGISNANGILIRNNSTGLQIVNNIVAYNNDDGVESTVNQYGAITSYNDVFGNGGTNWVRLTPGVGCMHSNPCFTGGIGAEAYFLQPNSPCIDAGDPTRMDPDSTRSDMGAFYFQQSGQLDLSIELEPVNPPIVIPVCGDSFQFNVTIQNNSSSYSRFDAWSALNLPSGYVISPMILRQGLFLPGNGTMHRTLTMEISPIAMSGTYWLVGMVGRYSNEIVDSDSFSFYKQPYDSGEFSASAFCKIWGWGKKEKYEIPMVISTQNGYSVTASPNPFNNITEVVFSLPESGYLEIAAYDALGRKAAELFSGRGEAGTSSVYWDAAGLPSGIYFIKIQYRGQVAAYKVLLMK